MITSLKRTVWVTLAATLTFPLACEQVGAKGLTVGGNCSSDSDCNYLCVRGDDYPGGMCTMSCADPDECPSETTCIDDEGGICAPECDADADCEDYGSTWKCLQTDPLGASGTVRVCRGGAGGSGGANSASSSSSSSSTGEGGMGEAGHVSDGGAAGK